MMLSLIFGMLVGIVLGLTGAGGGILAVPALVIGMGWSMQQAAPVALIAVAIGAAIGAIEGFRQKLVRYRAAMLIALAGAPFTLLGLRIAHALAQQWLMGLFAAVMLLVALGMFRQNTFSPQSNLDISSPGSVYPDTGRFVWSWQTGFLLGSIGAMTGFMTGLLGVGGGFVIVPMLRRFTKVSMHSIVATSLLVIALVGTTGIISAVAHGVVPPLNITALFAAATAAGMLIGRQLTKRLSPVHVQRGFAITLVVVATGLLIQAARVL